MINFPQIPHNRHPIARPWGRNMGCLFWIQILIYVLPQQLEYGMQHHVVLDRVITALDFMWVFVFVRKAFNYMHNFGAERLLKTLICLSNFPKGTHHVDDLPWWRHQMETFSELLALCAGNSPVTGEFPAQRPVTRSFNIFFVLCLNKRLSTKVNFKAICKTKLIKETKTTQFVNNPRNIINFIYRLMIWDDTVYFRFTDTF